MASIDSIGTKAAPKYRARWRTPDGASRSRTFRTKGEAERFLATVIVARAAGTYVDPRAGRTTLAEVAEAYLANGAPRWRPSTLALMRHHVERFIVPAFGKRAVASIGPSELKGWTARLVTERNLKPTTAAAVLRTLSAVLGEAVTDGLIATNPAKAVRGARRERKAKRVDPGHVESLEAKVPELAAAMPVHLSGAVLLMASTGLRPGEALGLTRDRVNFLRRSVRIDRQAVTLVGGPRFGPPKTEASVRTVPVPESVIRLLAEHVERFGTPPDGLLFGTTLGTMLARQHWSRTFRAACTVAGLPTGTRAHDLRHVAASGLIHAGLSVKAVQAELGHESASVTLDVYGHLWPSDEDRTRQAIDALTQRWAATG